MDVASILRLKGDRVETASPTTPLIDVARQLAERRIGAVVVVDGARQVVGIISERDIIRWLGSEGTGAMSVPVSQVMTHRVVTCERNDTLNALMERMTARRFRHLPVVEDEQLVGIVSIGDVVKHHIRDVEREADAMRQYIATA